MKTPNAMEAMETDRSRPRQVRYQAALRPDPWTDIIPRLDRAAGLLDAPDRDAASLARLMRDPADRRSKPADAPVRRHTPFWFDRLSRRSL